MRKKLSSLIISMLILTIFIGNFNIIVNATNQPDECISTTEIPMQTIIEEQSLEYQSTEEEGFKKENEEAYKKATQKDTDKNVRNSNFQLGPYKGLIYYSQIDNRWKNDPYTITGNPSQTIGTSGCGPTAAAMVVSSIKGIITPPQMAKLYVENGFRSKDNGTYWSAFRWTANKFGIGFEETQNLNEAINLVKNNYYVIVSVNDGLFTSGGHFVVIVGIDGEYLEIFDPYLYSGKFDIPSRKGKVTVKGNKVYCSIKNFRNYANYQRFFAFKNDRANSGSETGNLTIPEYTRYVKTSTGIGVNVRSGPGIRFSKITAYPDGTKVTVYEIKDNWARIGKNEWIDSNYLVVKYNNQVADNIFNPYKVKIISPIGLNIRKGNSIYYKKIGAYRYGAVVEVIAEKNGWGRTNIGWIDLQYTEKFNNINSTVGMVKYFKGRTILYQNPNLTGREYQYLPNTSVIILENVNSQVDKVRVIKTGRIAYVRSNSYITNYRRCTCV